MNHRTVIGLLMVDAKRRAEELRRRRGLRDHGGGAAAAAAPAGPSTYVEDTFTRADGPIGNAETGQAWVLSSAVWNVLTNRARATSLPTTVVIATIDSDQADGAWRLTWSANHTGGIAVRATDKDNLLQCLPAAGTIRLRRVTAGVITNIGTGGAITAGQVVKVVAAGDQVSVYIDDVLQFTVTESQNQTTETHGLSEQTTTGRLDNYSHKSE